MVHEGTYIAEVNVEIINSSEEGWSPYIFFYDAMKLDQVRDAFHRVGYTEMARFCRLFPIVKPYMEAVVRRVIYLRGKTR